MSQPADSRQDRLVALLAGDRRADEPEVLGWFRDDPSLRAEFEDLAGLAAAVEADARRERTLLAAALAMPDAAPGGSPPAARLRWRRLLGGLLAAAAAVLLGYLLWQPTPGAPSADDQRVLSGEPLVLEAPRWEPNGDLVLAWRSPLADAKFEAWIYDPATGPDVPTLECTAAEALATAWTIPASTAGKLPAGARLRVEARAGGRTIPRERPLR